MRRMRSRPTTETTHLATRVCRHATELPPIIVFRECVTEHHDIQHCDMRVLRYVQIVSNLFTYLHLLALGTFHLGTPEAFTLVLSSLFTLFCVESIQHSY